MEGATTETPIQVSEENDIEISNATHEQLSQQTQVLGDEQVLQEIEWSDIDDEEMTDVLLPSINHPSCLHAPSNNPALLVGAAYNQNRVSEKKSNVQSMMEFLNYKKDRCAICLFHSIVTLESVPSEDKHESKDCPRYRKRCLKCFTLDHTAEKCPIYK